MGKLKLRRLPVKEPAIKLTPIMKLTGRDTVSLIKISTLFLSELFCILIIRNKNKLKLNKSKKANFLNIKVVNF